ncbi:MAG TPA: hypothetical protein VFW23_11275 [Tepidisphaeraceae bacterium]|nr:hypothetical protein [Tepidisphaeraceae bacterium]
MNQRPKFHFFGDPICLASMIIYAVNRWYFKPHHIGGAFTQGYVNDLLCLPLFLPLILGVQRLIGLRKHDAPPRMWEVVQHAIIFSILFEVILPRYPRQFHTTADPWDAVAYLVGGVCAWMGWKLLAAAQRRGRQLASDDHFDGLAWSASTLSIGWSGLEEDHVWHAI